MYLKKLELNGFKSFNKKTTFQFDNPISAIVGPNGSGKSNVSEACRWVLGEQSMKSLRGRRGEDLIFSGSTNLPRSNRASVSLIFDNSKNKFETEFDEVSITREVFRDGVNEYYINGSKVRLRDVIELLSKVSLGASSHHIISQNESDRILLASLKDRKSMIEDALGLRVYHWKINESRRKLEKTKDNIKEAGSLRREISGHLRFLEKEAEKIEKAKKFKEDLLSLYVSYFKEERTYIKDENIEVENQKREPEQKIRELDKLLDSLGPKIEQDISEMQSDELKEASISLVDLGKKKDELSRQLGRLEGIIEFTKRDVEDRQKGEDITFSKEEVENLTNAINNYLDEADEKDNPEDIKGILCHIRDTISEFRKGGEFNGDGGQDIGKELKRLEEEKTGLESEIERLKTSEREVRNRQEELKSEITHRAKEEIEKERKYYEAKEHRAEAMTALEAIKGREQNIKTHEDDLEMELHEGKLIFGPDFESLLVGFQSTGVCHDETCKGDKKKEIEKLKIRIEEIGPASAGALDEYRQIKERDVFLEREMTDLEESRKSLLKLIEELEEKLEEEFKKGIEKINKELQKFFELMFGGGSASIKVVKIIKRAEEELYTEGDETEEGIDVTVNIPRKKIKGLEMLSGGERALTSIALLFAMTQVKPPPFLILDETDAALDEANSKKYGDMLEKLSKDTQLILITHNRETMSRAGVLYGVTMGRDSISKLLSVKFEEAVKIAK